MDELEYVLLPNIQLYLLVNGLGCLLLFWDCAKSCLSSLRRKACSQNVGGNKFYMTSKKFKLKKKGKTIYICLLYIYLSFIFTDSYLCDLT